MRVLIAEDHDATAAIIARTLRADGFDVDTTADGADLLAVCGAGEYDLLVLDRRLAGSDGLELCRELRAARCWVPVLIVSGMRGTTDVVHGLEAGADDYLGKPFAVEELRARVRAVLRRRGGAPAQPATSAEQPFCLDADTQRFLHADGEVALSQREFALLAALVQSGGRVLSRTELLRDVWQLDEANRKLVDVYVGYLRRKLKVVGDLVTIEPIRGVGYRLRTRQPEVRGQVGGTRS
ncbi:MAG: response regulator transcription factor [Nitriliruptor sp.]